MGCIWDEPNKNDEIMGEEWDFLVVGFYNKSQCPKPSPPSPTEGYWLVVSNIFYFPFHIWDVILPIDELIFCSEGLKPPTS